MKFLRSLFFSCFWFVLPLLASQECASKRLPDFLIIGAQKSGTTALSKILCQHPKVLGCEEEIHFFDRHYDLGVDWYSSHFPERAEEGEMLMDKTPSYLVRAHIPKKIHSLVPNAKILVLLRNPVDRAYSHYWMNVRRGEEKRSFDQAIFESKQNLALGIRGKPGSYLGRGFYAEQLKSWFAYYPPEQMMILSYEEFLSEPRKTLSEILLFLRLPEYDEFDFSVGKVNDYPPMEPRLRRELEDLFRPLNAELEALLGREFPWNNADYQR